MADPAPRHVLLRLPGPLLRAVDRWRAALAKANPHMRVSRNGALCALLEKALERENADRGKPCD